MSRRKTHCLACEKDGARTKPGAGVRIVFDPAIQLRGTPTIEGHTLSAEQMAWIMYEHGKDEIYDYDLTHEEIIAACWWAGRWGPRKLRKAWAAWGIEAGAHLWHGCINVPLPPTRAEIEAMAG